MIKINLASRKKSAVAQVRAPGEIPKISFDSSTLTGLVSDLKELNLKKIGIGLAAGVLAMFLVNGYMDDQVKTLNEELETLNKEKPKLQAEANKMRSLEELQKRMEADEKVIRDKLVTIQKLSTERGSAVQLLEEVAKMTPAEIWLSDLELKGTDFSLKGLSQDATKISEYVRSFQSNSIFEQTNSGGWTKVPDEQKREVMSFSLTARKRATL